MDIPLAAVDNGSVWIDTESEKAVAAGSFLAMASDGGIHQANQTGALVRISVGQAPVFYLRRACASYK
jgi:hypothetical protein